MLVWFLPIARGMQNFKSYLLAMHIAGPKAVDFYLHWVTRFYRFLNKQPGDTVTQQEMDSYLKHLSKSRESWQVDQAAKAIRVASRIFRTFECGGIMVQAATSSFSISLSRSMLR
jgi:hypothetical protein